MDTTSLEDFYSHKTDFYKDSNAAGILLPEGISNEIGHFNVFDVAKALAQYKNKPTMPYNRRQYYKISFIKGRNRAEYADKQIEIEKYALLFASPRVPYNWLPLDENQGGFFCIFTEEFLVKSKSGIVPDELPIFSPGSYPVFELNDAQAAEIEQLYKKMYTELEGTYAYKYDLLRNYLLELIHYGQKLQPSTELYTSNTSSARISSLFIELLERQFPITANNHKIALRTAADYAGRLSVHVNHLNKALKEHTGSTTTELIRRRILQEAKILLKQTTRSVSEIAYALGFEEVAHFSNFFKKETAQSPLAFRG
ncbi:helix-turn-helix domain-containing protein [Flavobacterium akiainvivens]|uniref:helix-turn-helix domain-containing protein n=1 Tax=Flavobacterium akiainvivens TaxID=1202724 RepID=UPI0006C88D81|nr:helix-turn-helix domain-containing protein [Flavobacterium akiainvivens]SFQ47147.1 transcriptional regulator, AraC family [Flavobacterium akiainvivens]